MIGPAISSLTFEFGPQFPGLVAAGLCTLNWIFAFYWLPESMPTHERDTKKARQPIRTLALQVLFQPRGDRARLIWIYAVGMLGFISMTAVLPLYLKDEFGVTERNIGFFFVFIGALSVVMRAIVLGWAVDKFGETRVMQVGATLLAFGLVAIPLPGTVMLTAFAMGLVPIGTALLFPTVSALVSHRTEPGEMGQTLGVQQAFGGVARVIAPIWATIVYQGFGINEPFFIAAGVVGFVSFLTYQVQPMVTPEASPEPAA
jgi:nitrate/nitrite transporter NarK